MRLRIFHLTTPWFWFVAFYQHAYGKPRLEMNLFDGPSPSRWRLHCWGWEPISEEWGTYGRIQEVPGTPKDL